MVVKAGHALLFAAIAALPLIAAQPKKPLGEPRVYKRVGAKELKLHIIRPDDWKASDLRPAIVFFHGGGWVSGAPTQFNEHSAYFATRGLVCILVQYRLMPNTQEPPLRCVHDARSAMRWVRRHASELGIDPDRIASAGGSAGGHLAAHVGMVDALDDPGDDRRVSAKSNAMLLFNPVLDNGPNGHGHPRIGDLYPSYSPAHNVSPDDPPAIVFLGSEDKLIPVATMERFKAAMDRAGVPCVLRIYEGQGHGFFNVRNEKYHRLTVMEAEQFLVSLGWLAEKRTD